MNICNHESGLHVLTAQELAAHGSHVAGGAAYGTETVGGFAADSASSRSLAYAFLVTTAIGFAQSLGRCFNSFSRTCCISLVTRMRNRYTSGTASYNYFNRMLIDMGVSTTTLDTIIERAGRGDYGTKPDPPV